MTGCCAAGCTNRSGQGYKFYRWPRNAKRRRKWTDNFNRSDFVVTEFSTLCEVHFTEANFHMVMTNEGLRRRLIPDAVPTVFAECLPDNSGSRKRKKWRKVMDPAVALETAAFVVRTEHSYAATGSTDFSQPTMDPTAVPEGVSLPTIPLAVTEIAEESTVSFLDIGGEEEVSTMSQYYRELAKHNVRTIAALRSETADLKDKLKHEKVKLSRSQKECGRSRKELECARSQLAMAQEELAMFRPEGGFFGKDELTYMRKKGLRGQEWSKETIEKAYKVRVNVGVMGYEVLRKLNYPLPPLRTLQDRVKELKPEPGAINDPLLL